MWLLAQLDGTTETVFHGVGAAALAVSGFPVEYQVAKLFSRDAGRLSADLEFYWLPDPEIGTPLSATRRFTFTALPTHDVALAIRDADGRGCVASLIVRDALGLVYPPRPCGWPPNCLSSRRSTAPTARACGSRMAPTP